MLVVVAPLPDALQAFSLLRPPGVVLDVRAFNQAAYVARGAPQLVPLIQRTA